MTITGSSMIRGAILVAILAVILLIFYLPVNHGVSALQSSGTTYGRILVDSPEIYTRERMVNDRFRQEAWLLEQLDKLPEEDAGVQVFVKNQSSSKRNAKLSVSLDGTTAVPEGEPPAPEASSSPLEDTGQAKLSPIEYFRGRQSVRDEVRNALIENQLDDRHDLGGNTLYRLKFDATVIPGNDTSAWAQINIRFKRKISGDAEEEQARKELYWRWMSDLQEEINTDYNEDVAKEVENQDAEPRWYKALFNQNYIYIGDESTRREWEEILGSFDSGCEQSLFKKVTSTNKDNIDDNLILQGYSPDGFNCLLKLASVRMGCDVDKCKQQLVQEDVMAKVLDRYGTTLGQKVSVRKGLKKSSKGNDSLLRKNQRFNTLQPQSSQQYVSFLPADDYNSILVEEYSAKIYAVPVELNQNERKSFNANRPTNTNYALPLELNDSERDSYNESADQQYSDADILQDWANLLNCTDKVKISVSERVFEICNETFTKIKPFKIQDNASDEPYLIDVKILNEFDGLPYLVSKVSDSDIIAAWSAVQSCAKESTASILVAQREFKICDSWMEDLRELSDSTVIGNEPFSIDAKIETSYDGMPIIVAPVGYVRFRQKLKKSEQDKFLFSYAVTPREGSQQMASSSRQAVAEQLRASAAGQAGASIGAERSSLFSEYAQTMLSRPIIVGVASHSKHINGAQTIEESAELGWLIGPKLTVGKDGLTTYRHLPSQNSLSALVSAPSWWRRANIEVETGWLNEGGELIGSPVKYNYPIALPGDQDEITAAILREGRRAKPHIDSVEPLFVYLGSEAKLLIEGQNLWRSTVVTIGAQRSKKIYVLPNMKGIIAEFDKINAQEVGKGDNGQTTRVRVWTSEGVADSKQSFEVRINPNKSCLEIC